MEVPTVTIETEVPEDVYRTLQAHGVFREELNAQVRQLLALRFYQTRALSLGQAARLANRSRWEFIEYLAENDVPVIDYTNEELADEFAAALKFRTADDDK